MTIIKKNIARKVKDITLGSTLFLTLAGGGLQVQSCKSNNNGAEGNYGTEEAEVYTKGVKTFIKEVNKGEFKITGEQKVPIDSAVAIVTYLNGKRDTLKPALAKALIDKEMQGQGNMQNNGSYGHHNTLSNALLYGGMGYMLSRMMGGNNNQYSNYRQRYDEENRMKGSSSSVYSSPKVYDEARSMHESVASSKVTMSRPIGSRSGFFHGSSHASIAG